MLQETELHPYYFSQFNSRSPGAGRKMSSANAWRSRITSFVYQGVYRNREFLTLIGTAGDGESCLVTAVRHANIRGIKCRCYAVLP